MRMLHWDFEDWALSIWTAAISRCSMRRAKLWSYLTVKFIIIRNLRKNSRQKDMCLQTILIQNAWSMHMKNTTRKCWKSFAECLGLPSGTAKRKHYLQPETFLASNHFIMRKSMEIWSLHPRSKQSWNIRSINVSWMKRLWAIIWASSILLWMRLFSKASIN